MYCKREDEGPRSRKLIFVFDFDDLRYVLRDANDKPLPLDDNEDLELIADGVFERLSEALDWGFEQYALDMYDRVYG